MTLRDPIASKLSGITIVACVLAGACPCAWAVGPGPAAETAAPQVTGLPQPLGSPTDVYAIALRPPPTLPPLPPPGSPPDVIGRAHAARAAAMAGTDQWEQIDSGRTVRNVSRPTITPVLPDPDKATGAAVILVPDASLLRLEIDAQGYKVAHALAAQGVAAIVLKYRTGESPRDPAQFVAAQAERRKVLARAGGAAPAADEALLEDVRDALAVARRRAEEMGVDPQRIGLLGFSSAGVSVLPVALDANSALRPAFFATVDSALQARPVPPGAPPFFAAVAADDKSMRKGASALVKSWQKSKAAASLSSYSKADEAPAPWGAAFVAWLQSRGLLKPSG
jgi:dienelactone hydrolase